MPRTCTICNLEEHRLTIDTRLRAGESVSAVAKEFGVSEDSLLRHKQKHLRRETTPDDLSGRLEQLWLRSDELYSRALAANDVKTAVDCLGRLSQIAAELSRMKARDAGFETLTLQQKVAVLRADQPLMVALLDDMVSAHRLNEAAAKMATEQPQQSQQS